MPRNARPLFVLCAALLVPLACGGASGGAGTAGAAELFAANCVVCHQSSGQGSALAPTLHGKAAHWTREKLVDYLIDPQAYAEKDERLRAQGGKYSLPMPKYKTLSRAELEALADHVLAMP